MCHLWLETSYYYLLITGNCFGCGKDGIKVRNCPNIASREKGKKVEPSVPNKDAPTKRRFYALWTRG